jgi:flavin-binding protein dodecin
VPVITVTKEITVTSLTGPEEAATQAAAIATAGLANVERVEVKHIEVVLENGNITGYRVTVEVAYGEAALARPEYEELPRGATFEDLAEALRAHVLLEDLPEDEIEAADRHLIITPAKRGSGLTDVSIDHDRYLAGD